MTAPRAPTGAPRRAAAAERPRPKKPHPKVADVWERAARQLEHVDISTREGQLEAIRVTSRAERLSRSLKRALRHDRRRR